MNIEDTRWSVPEGSEELPNVKHQDIMESFLGLRASLNRFEVPGTPRTVLS